MRMIQFVLERTKLLRSLFFLFLIVSATACASETVPPPTPPPLTRARTTVPATKIASPTALPTETIAPTNTTQPAPTDAPTNTATKIAPTRVPATATKIPATAAPTDAPTAEPTTNVVAAPPADFAPTELITIPEGSFKMGGKAENDDPDEKPFHDVELYEFRIEKFEVTNAQYQACVAAKVCAPPVSNASYTRDAYFGNPEFANYPVVNVTWNDANAYCTWLGRRLPNEAEWERAAKGVENWRYTWSNSIGMHFEWNAIFHGSPISFCEASCPLQNYWGDVNDGFPDTAPVGRFAEFDSSSGFGVIDMAGNVAEWTNNWYYGNAYAEGMDIYGPNEPTGVKAVRGGSWASEPTRNSDRDPRAPDYASDRIGFRCAQ